MAATYAHATAPLRRLADRYVIEATLAIANGRPVPDDVAAAFAALPSTMARCEQRANTVDRAVIDLAEAVLLAGREGEVFDAVVVDEDRHGPLVQLVEPAVMAHVAAHRVDPGDAGPRAPGRCRPRGPHDRVHPRRLSGRAAALPLAVTESTLSVEAPQGACSLVTGDRRMDADDATTSPAPSSPDFDRQVEGIATLGDPLRRALYRYVISRPGPVNRDQVAEGAGVARHVVKFHLDRLADEGLLAVEYARPAGRGGPGAGRPAKLYRRAAGEVTVSLPPRDYQLAGGCWPEPSPMRNANGSRSASRSAGRPGHWTGARRPSPPRRR